MSKYKFWNVNPEHLLENDCVTRAITEATGLTYHQIQEKLFYIGKLLECDSLCLCCYSFLLDNIFCFERIRRVKGITIEEFANIYNNGVYLVRVKQHLSVVSYGTILDIWDCSNEIITDCWKAKRIV